MNDFHNQVQVSTIEQLELQSKSFMCIYLDVPYNTNTIRSTISTQYSDKFPSRSAYMTLIEMVVKKSYDALHQNGSFFIQCDYRTSHYIKILCDQIFGDDNFRSEIIWKRHDYTAECSNKLGMMTDSIFYYTKSDHFVFHPQSILMSNEQILKTYSNIESHTLRRYNTHPMWKSGNSPKTLTFHDRGVLTAPSDMRYVWSQDKYEAEYQKNPNVIYWTKTGSPRIKHYLDDDAGILLGNLWTDIEPVSPNMSEYADYPTQKPLKLLERLILLSTNEQDLVGDFCCGSGTTCVAAKLLNRQYFGSDQNSDAIRIAKQRLLSCDQSVSSHKQLFQERHLPLEKYFQK